jgi:hypothetical protein
LQSSTEAAQTGRCRGHILRHGGSRHLHLGHGRHAVAIDELPLPRDLIQGLLESIEVLHKLLEVPSLYVDGRRCM